MKISAIAALAAISSKGINLAARIPNIITADTYVKIATTCLAVVKESSPSLRL